MLCRIEMIRSLMTFAMGGRDVRDVVATYSTEAGSRLWQIPGRVVSRTQEGQVE